MKKIILSGLTLCLALSFGTARAFFVNFEDGVDMQPVHDLPGLSFESYNGYEPIYGDTRSGYYNTYSDDLGFGPGIYHHNGNFFLWAGPNALALGVVVDFTNDDATWFTTGYSSLGTFHIDAHLTDGSTVSTTGAGNSGNPMEHLTVNAVAGTRIDYVVLHHELGNAWLADDMSGDAGVNPIPEPASLLLLGGGILGAAIWRRTRSA